MSGRRATRDALSVGLIGCGRVGLKRAAAIGADRLVGCHDVDRTAAEALAALFGGAACVTVDDLLGLAPDVVVVATPHDALSELACRALQAGSHVLVEKPAGRSTAEVDAIAAHAQAARRLVKVGFNHRFHPGIARAVEEAVSGIHGPIMFARGNYGHGGRVGYELEWRALPAVSGGGELMDQGMHMLDLSHWLLGPLPLHAALLRTNFWDMVVEDNAVVTLADSADPHGPWASFIVSWSEWKNEFALAVYCERAKLQVVGLTGSYGPQVLRIYRMAPELGPPEVEELRYEPGDHSWAAEWRHFREAILAGGPLLGDLESARYGLACVAEAYQRAGFPLGSS